VGVGSDEELSVLGKALCRLALPHFDSISVRDRESQEMIERWTRGAPVVHLTNDIAVDLPEADFAAIEPALREEGISLERDTVVIAARKVFHHNKSPLYFLPSSLRTRLGLQPREAKRRVEEFKNTLSRLCDYMIERYGVQVLFMPFYGSGGSLDSRNEKTPTRLFSSGDNAFAQDVIGRIRAREHVKLLTRNYSPEELLAIIARCRAMIGVPYHSVVFASSRNVPVLGINYVSKVERYLRILGLEEFGVYAGAPFEVFKERFDHLWAERAAITEKLKAKNRELAELADENVRIIHKVLRAHSS
jgi:polysaccharide pyruvyl transferase WcaK-like protein